MNPDIIKIAHRVREEISDLIHGDDWNFNAETLECACALASWTLNEVLLRSGFRTRFVVGVWVPPTDAPNHCWVEVNERFIIDISATQFGISDRVFIVDSSYLCYRPLYWGTLAEDEVRYWDKQSPFRWMCSLQKIVDRIVKERS